MLGYHYHLSKFHIYALVYCIGGEGNGSPLQYCLENPRDRGAWWAAVYGVAQSWTQLKQLSSSSIQSEVSQKEKHQYSILTHIYGI